MAPACASSSWFPSSVNVEPSLASSFRKEALTTRSKSHYCSMKKKVSFAPAKRCSIDQPTLTESLEAPAHHSEAVFSELWYQPNEFARFHRQVQRGAQTIQTVSSMASFLQSLEDCHTVTAILLEEVHIPNTDVQWEAQEIMRWKQISKQLQDVPLEVLTRWCDTPFRGLEKYASKQLRHTKASTRRKMIRDLDLQGYNKSQNDEENNNQETLRTVFSVEELAERLQRRSQTSRFFARLMGMADAAVAVRESC